MRTYTHWQVGDVGDSGSKESDEKDEHEENAKADDGSPFSESCALVVLPREVGEIRKLLLLFGSHLVQKSGGQQESVLTQVILLCRLSWSRSHLLEFGGRP